MTPVERFWRKVAVGAPDECWLWKDHLVGGYGSIWFEGRPRRAHRVMWQLTHGPIDAGLCVLHSCDVPACVNPAHLRLGTHAENMREMAERGRSVCPCSTNPSIMRRGERHPHAVLNDEKVRRIRSLRAGGSTVRQIAATFGVSTRTVRAVLDGVSWRHVSEAA